MELGLAVAVLVAVAVEVGMELGLLLWLGGGEGGADGADEGDADGGGGHGGPQTTETDREPVSGGLGRHWPWVKGDWTGQFWHALSVQYDTTEPELVGWMRKEPAGEWFWRLVWMMVTG